MMRFLIFLMGFMLLFSFAQGQRALASELTIDLAEDFVDITTGFGGAHLVVFGTQYKKGDLAIVIEGPEKEAVVRRKSNVFGVWMNTDVLEFKKVPIYYDYAIQGQGQKAINESNAALLARHKIGIDPRFFVYDDAQGEEKDVAAFQAALLRTKQEEGVYPRMAKGVHFLNDELFRVEFYLPASVPKGEYKVTGYLMDNGRLLDRQEKTLDVQQVGFSSTVNKVAYEYAFGYGCLCVLLALFAGWAINALRRGF